MIAVNKINKDRIFISIKIHSKITDNLVQNPNNGGIPNQDNNIKTKIIVRILLYLYLLIQFTIKVSVFELIIIINRDIEVITYTIR
jgi:hypothetical protein